MNDRNQILLCCTAGRVCSSGLPHFTLPTQRPRVFSLEFLSGVIDHYTRLATTRPSSCLTRAMLSSVFFVMVVSVSMVCGVVELTTTTSSGALSQPRHIGSVSQSEEPYLHYYHNPKTGRRLCVNCTVGIGSGWQTVAVADIAGYFEMTCQPTPVISQPLVRGDVASDALMLGVGGGPSRRYGDGECQPAGRTEGGARGRWIRT